MYGAIPPGPMLSGGPTPLLLCVYACMVPLLEPAQDWSSSPLLPRPCPSSSLLLSMKEKKRECGAMPLHRPSPAESKPMAQFGTCEGGLPEGEALHAGSVQAAAATIVLQSQSSACCCAAASCDCCLCLGSSSLPHLESKQVAKATVDPLVSLHSRTRWGWEVLLEWDGEWGALHTGKPCSACGKELLQ